AMATYSSLRWLISITDRPRPCQSRSSAWALRRTASGSAAGPAQKLWARMLTSTLSCWAPGAARPSPILLRLRAATAARTCLLFADHGGVSAGRCVDGVRAFGRDALQLLAVVRGLLHPLQTDQGLALGQLNQGH